MINNDFKNSAREYTSTLLWHIGAVRFMESEPFKYASGNHGPIYIDVRRVISHPIHKKVIAGFLANIVTLELDRDIDTIIGGETAGMSFAEQLADLINKPYYYVRKKPKGHGLSSSIVGDPLVIGNKAVLIEDLINDGRSKIMFGKEIRKYMTCNDVVAIYDRQQGGRELLKKSNYNLYSVTEQDFTFDLGKRIKCITDDQYEDYLDYMKDAKQWNEDRGLEWHD